MTLRPLFVDEQIGNQLPALDGNRLRDAVNDPYEPSGFYSAALGNAATVDIPGPAAGLVRLFDDIALVSDALESALTSVTLDVISSSVAYRFSRLTTITATQTAPTIALGYGEVIRVVNAGAPTGRIQATYTDVPEATISLVRLAVTAVAQTVIPAPTAGYFSRWSQRVPLMSSTSRLTSTRLRIYNTDVVTHSYQFTLGGTLVSRTATATTLAATGPLSPLQIPVTADTGALAILTTEAINTNNPSFVGSYETLPIPTSR